MLTKKYAMITGAAGDIGSEIAQTYAKAGAYLALIDCDSEGLKKIAKKIKNCTTILANLREEHSIEQAVKKAYSVHPQWDILVNNAGIVKRGPLLEFNADDWDMIQEVNLRSIFLLSRLVAKKMIAQGGGKIINMSSNATFYGTPGSGPYAVSKAGIIQLTKTMAIEWGSSNIQVNAVCPSIIMTKLGRRIWEDPKNAEMKQKFIDKIPLGRFAEVGEISPLFLFLASSGSNFINGAIIPIDAGAQYNPV